MDANNPIDRLSLREREVLRLASVHMTSKEIARQLGLSPKTVDRHMANAMGKLGLPSRWAAVRLFVQGAVPGPSPDPGENPPAQSSPMAETVDGAQSPRSPKAGPPQKGVAPWFDSHGLAPVILRFVIDAALVTIFFAILTTGAMATHWIVAQSEAAHVDHIVVLMLKAVHYALVAIDGVGVVLATVLLTFRFLKALKAAK